jgi:hypothetical protein
MAKKVKWGKIGAPKSEKRKKWLAGLRRKKKSGGTKSKVSKRAKPRRAHSSTQSSKGLNGKKYAFEDPAY